MFERKQKRTHVVEYGIGIKDRRFLSRLRLPRQHRIILDALAAAGGSLSVAEAQRALDAVPVHARRQDPHLGGWDVNYQIYLMNLGFREAKAPFLVRRGKRANGEMMLQSVKLVPLKKKMSPSRLPKRYGKKDTLDSYEPTPEEWEKSLLSGAKTCELIGCILATPCSGLCSFEKVRRGLLPLQ